MSSLARPYRASTLRLSLRLTIKCDYTATTHARAFSALTSFTYQGDGYGAVDLRADIILKRGFSFDRFDFEQGKP
jgi:glutamine cyclotransferase